MGGFLKKLLTPTLQPHKLLTGGGSKKKPVITKPSIAVGEPNPSAPRPRTGPMAGYTGPKVGSAEWKAARARGEHPVMDYMKTQRAAKKLSRPSMNQSAVAPKKK